MDGKEQYAKANEAFVEESYQEALKLYNEAIELNQSNDLYFTGRSQVYIKLDKYSEALEDANKALDVNPQNVKAYLRKGVACYNLGDFETAKSAFEAGHGLSPGDYKFEDWITKCTSSLLEAKSQKEEESHKPQSPPVPQILPQPDVIPMPSGPKTKYEWYQTETHVVVTILVKDVKKEKLKCDIQEHSLSCTISLPTGTDYSLELDLAHTVVPEQSQIKILSTKVEIKLKKVEGIRWNKLENDGTRKNVKNFTSGQPASDTACRYPSSSQHTKDWDKLVTEIKAEEKDEKLEGDAALNQLFQQIYSDGSDEVRKAMNKSFSESGGTVLSTNWKEIGEKPVEVKPPDGMEYRKL